jgi:hypothetical protein
LVQDGCYKTQLICTQNTGKNKVNEHNIVGKKKEHVQDKKERYVAHYDCHLPNENSDNVNGTCLPILTDKTSSNVNALWGLKNM